MALSSICTESIQTEIMATILAEVSRKQCDKCYFKKKFLPHACKGGFPCMPIISRICRQLI